MLFCHDRCSAFNSEYLEFEVLHFQIVGLDKQTGDEGANVLAVLTASMRACAREASKNVFFGLWLYHPHPIVDFAVTVEILCLHHAAQDAAKPALLLPHSMPAALRLHTVHANKLPAEALCASSSACASAKTSATDEAFPCLGVGSSSDDDDEDPAGALRMPLQALAKLAFWRLVLIGIRIANKKNAATVGMVYHSSITTSRYITHRPLLWLRILG